MTAMTGLEALAKGAVLSPFTRLARLLADIPPGNADTIEMTAGDPKETMPGFVVDRIAEAKATLGTYPRIRGSDDLRKTLASWIDRRYGIAPGVDFMREVHPLNGSREGLFFAMLPAVGRKQVEGRPVVLLPNPFYQAYLGAAYGTNCEAVFLNATDATGHLPDLDEIADDEALLKRTVAFFLCSPANPQGAVASKAYVLRALELARKYDFMLFFDECYSEIYTGDTAPTGGLEVAAKTPERFRNIVVFNSLSKRSNLPGLRSGFAAGDRRFPRNLRRGAQPHRAADAGHHPARLGRGVGRRAARGGDPAGLSHQVRHLRRGAEGPLRLPAAGRRLLPVARYESLGKQRRCHRNPLETLWCESRARCLPGAGRA